MLLAFWMNLYFIISCFLFILSTVVEFNISYLLYFLLSLIPLFIISIKKKFEIPFFKIFLFFNLIICFISSLMITLFFYSDELKQQNTIPDAHPISFFSTLGIPIITTLFLILIKHFINFKHKIIHFIINIIAILNSFFSIFWIAAISSLSFLFLAFDASTNPEYPPMEEYPSKVVELSDSNPYRTSHFPKNLPSNVSNYSFKIDNEPRGWNIDMLSINTDKKFIETLLVSNKSKIDKKIKFTELEKYYKHLHLVLDVENQNEDTYTTYILKNENNDNNYTSGFVISEETQRVIFFYANYNLIVI